MVHPKAVIAAPLLLAGWLTTNHFSPWVSWHAELPFFLLTLLLAAYGVFRHAKPDALAFPVAAAIPLVLCAMVGLQYLGGLVPWRGQAVVALLYALLAVTFIQTGWQEARRADEFADRRASAGEWLAWTLIAGAILSVAIAFVQVLDIWEDASFVTRLSQLRRPGGNLGQANHLATLLVMAIGATMFLNLRRRLSIPTATLILLLLVSGTAITESRTGLISALSICVLWACKRPENTHAFPRSFAASLSAAVVAMFVAWPSIYRFWAGGAGGGESATERLGSSGSDPRIVLWQQVLEATWLKPWAGWGFRNTAEAHNAISHTGVSTLPITYSHNLLLDLAVWFGWPIALIVATVLVMWLFKRFRRIETTPLAWFGFSLILPFGIHCLLEFPFAYAYLLMPAMVGVGWIEGSLRPEQVTLNAQKRWLVPPLLAMLVVSSWSAIDYLRVEEDFRVARFQMLRIGPPPDTPPPRILLLDQLGDMVASTRVPLKPGLDAGQLDLLRKAAVHNPWSGSQYRYATALALNGQPEEARRQMRVLLAQHGFKAYRVLAHQLEKDLADRGLPTLDLSLEKPR